jgi:hypothetical protein
LLNSSIFALLGRNFPALRDRRRLLRGSVFAPLDRNFLLSRNLPAAFAEGNASSHTRMYLAEVLVCPGLSRAIGRRLWETLRERVREGLSGEQHPGAECSGGTRCEYGVLIGALVDPLDRGPRLDDELRRLEVEIAVVTVTTF